MQEHLHILIVEDSKDDADLIARGLTQAGYQLIYQRVDTAAELETALDRDRWDLVISDHNMPQLDSFEALAILRARALDLPFIVMSRAIGEETAVAVMKAGAHDYIHKENPRRLIPAIQRELKEAEERRQHRQAQEDLKKSHESLRRTLEGTVQALASTAEKRDPYTADHQRHVSELSCAMAEFLGLPEDVIQGIRIAGLIHDIGKISVPVEILNKSGAISDFERNIVETHPEAAYDILKGIEFSWPIADIVLQHHERLDGSGYPGGLQGDEILLEAKILAVADVFEAVSSHRPYRPARGVAQALSELTINKDKKYAANVTDACLAVLRTNKLSFGDEHQRNWT